MVCFCDHGKWANQEGKLKMILKRIWYTISPTLYTVLIIILFCLGWYTSFNIFGSCMIIIYPFFISLVGFVHDGYNVWKKHILTRWNKSKNF